MKTKSLSKKILAVMGLAMSLTLTACPPPKGGGKKNTVAVPPTQTCTTGICQTGSGNQLFAAAGYWGTNPNYFMILNINTPNGQPSNYQQNGQYNGGYSGPVSVTGYIRSINPNNGFICDLLDGEYDIITTQPGNMQGFNIFSGITVDLVHRGSGTHQQGVISSGFFASINPWTPPGSSVAYNYGVYANLYYNGPQQGCFNSLKVIGLP